MQAFSLAGLLARLADDPALQHLRDRIAMAGDGAVLGPLGLPEPARAAVVAALLPAMEAPLLWLVDQPDEARAVADSLRAYLPDPGRVHVLPAPDAMPFERIPWDPTTRELRLAALNALHRHRCEPTAAPPPVIVASVRALLVHTLPPRVFEQHARVLRLGQRLQQSELMEDLVGLGYEIVGTVSDVGQAARRGGILDLFPPGLSRPVRIEWFGDEIDSMRLFERASQRSMQAVEEVEVLPAAEALATNGAAVAAQLDAVDARKLHPLADSELARHRRLLEAGAHFQGIEFYLPLLHPERALVLDYVDARSWVIIDSPDRLGTVAQGLHEQGRLVLESQAEAGELPATWPARPLATWAEAEAKIEGLRQLRLGQIGHNGGFEAGGGAVAFSPLAERFGQPPTYGGRIEEAVVDVAEITESGRAVVVVSRQAPRFVELLDGIGLHVAVTERLETTPGPGGLAVVHGALGSGWTLADAPSDESSGPRSAAERRLDASSQRDRGNGDGSDGAHDGQLIVLTDGELFGWRMPHRRRRSRSVDPGRKIDYFAEYSPGDYIVHIEHGIGLFRGIERMAVGEVERDYLKLEYAAGDMLFVPSHQADRVARYVGTGEIEPAVSRLGTADWERAKSRAKKAVENIAQELLELYARRESARRAAFAPDTAWQAEMEAAFPYFETEDQLRAIEDVKSDMESERPMDRLVVGDVGFGKTEVALRAAFKAVMGGKQVAILAPTTVLVQQHFETFTRRMMAFPVRIDVLSRYRSRKQQAEIVQQLADHEIDIIIGTHRLISADVKFHDLGLLVIDEEHRFGVKHKERLRQIRENVDTLTLTATPIPRTMHMALTGLRDLTTIETPPEERLPVATHVGPYDEKLVRQAIRREIGRRGQVFYVYNRVRGIEMVAQKIQKLLPEVRIGVAHGQMKQGELARAMLEFVGGQIDVLVCTSIVESGLDIPNANTLIVERADRFGLAQLHQLRGRVGRSAQRAYAYFLHPVGHELQPEALERLETMASSTGLGAGYRIAMRDLEMRGAGEILGARQHGQVAAIGLDLYTRLLAEAIKKLRADAPDRDDRVERELAEIDPGTLPTVDLPVDAFLPDRYVAETSERTRLYRRMAAATDLEAVGEIENELKDRFGTPPWEVQFLLDVLWLRVLAHLAGARSVAREGQWVVVRWKDSHALDRARLKPVLPADTRIGRHQVSLSMAGRPDHWLPRIRKALESIVEVEGRHIGR